MLFYRSTGLYRFLALPQNIVAKAAYSCAKANIHALSRPVFLAIVLAAFVFFSHIAFAALVAIPQLSTRVTDLTQTLSAEQQAQLEQKLTAFEAKKGSQIALLIVPSTQPEEIEQYAIRVVEQWKIGREKVDDGVLILIAKNDRKMRIEVGYGLEGAIPDLYAKRIISEVIGPKFKQGDFYGGLDSALDKLTGLIEGEALPAPSAQAANGKSGDFPLGILLFIGLFGAAILPSIFGRFFGSTANAGLVGGAAGLLGASLPIVGIFGLVAFAFAMFNAFDSGGRSARERNGAGGYNGGGGWTSGGGGGSRWGGGGGDFGGGGASGDW